VTLFTGLRPIRRDSVYIKTRKPFVGTATIGAGNEGDDSLELELEILLGNIVDPGIGLSLSQTLIALPKQLPAVSVRDRVSSSTSLPTEVGGPTVGSSGYTFVPAGHNGHDGGVVNSKGLQVNAASFEYATRRYLNTRGFDGGGYVEKNIKGTSKLSDHAFGLAGDLMCSGSRNDEIFNWTIANAAQFEVKYVIGNSKIWSPGNGLRACTGSLCGSDNHTTHVHVSFKKPTRTSY
jgi:hypothetical protein